MNDEPVGVAIVSQQRTRNGLVAVALTLTCVLAGCSSGDAAAPKPLPSSSGSPSAAVSVSPSASIPPQDLGATKAGAEAFVRFYVKTFNEASATGKTTSLANLELASCVSCAKVISRIQAVYQAGGRLIDTGWVVTRLSSAKQGSRFAVRADIRLPRQIVITKRGARPTTYTGGILHATYRLTRVGKSWRVSDLEREA